MSDHLQLIKFWLSHAPGKGVCGGAKTFGSTLLQPVRSVYVSLSTFLLLEKPRRVKHIQYCGVMEYIPNMILFQKVFTFTASVLSWVVETIFDNISAAKLPWLKAA